jgi:hypothetical protein
MPAIHGLSEGNISTSEPECHIHFSGKCINEEQLLVLLEGALSQRLHQGMFHCPGLLHISHSPLQLSVPLLSCPEPLLGAPSLTSIHSEFLVTFRG